MLALPREPCLRSVSGEESARLFKVIFRNLILLFESIFGRSVMYYLYFYEKMLVVVGLEILGLYL
jgi:hypothetical protein